jgi:hypothetical protein
MILIPQYGGRISEAAVFFSDDELPQAFADVFSRSETCRT